jgi:hypothetical protein
MSLYSIVNTPKMKTVGANQTPTAFNDWAHYIKEQNRLTKKRI